MIFAPVNLLSILIGLASRFISSMHLKRLGNVTFQDLTIIKKSVLMLMTCIFPVTSLYKFFPVVIVDKI